MSYTTIEGFLPNQNDIAESGGIYPMAEIRALLDGSGFMVSWKTNEFTWGSFIIHDEFKARVFLQEGTMRIKCRGYDGVILSLRAYERELAYARKGVAEYVVAAYDLEIRLPDGAVVKLVGVSPKEIEVLHT